MPAACPVATVCGVGDGVVERPTAITQHVEKLDTFCLTHRHCHAAAEPAMVSQCAGLTVS